MYVPGPPSMHKILFKICWMIVVLGYIMGHNPQILKSTSEMYTFLHTPLLLYL